MHEEPPAKDDTTQQRLCPGTPQVCPGPRGIVVAGEYGIGSALLGQGLNVATLMLKYSTVRSSSAKILTFRGAEAQRSGGAGRMGVLRGVVQAARSQAAQGIWLGTQVP